MTTSETNAAALPENIQALLNVLREAGDHDRNPYDGSGPLAFCHEAADLIENLLAGQDSTPSAPKEQASGPLVDMVNKLDNVRPGVRGYIANREETVDILNSLTESLPVSVFPVVSHYGSESNGDDVRVEITTSFTITRSEIGMF